MKLAPYENINPRHENIEPKISSFILFSFFFSLLKNDNFVNCQTLTTIYMSASTIVNSSIIAQLMGWSKNYAQKRICAVKKVKGFAYVTLADCMEVWNVSTSC